MGRVDAARSARWEFTSTGRNHVRSVSGFIPNRPATLLTAAQSERSLVGGRSWTWAARY